MAREIITPELLIAAYSQGYFPMADPGSGEILWYSPDPRTIIELDHLRISRSLRQTIRKARFAVQTNTSFERVMRACADRPETWISEEIVQSYLRLFKAGVAHSVECWTSDGLAGGLYGVALGGAFFGESMFSRERDASKVALVWLVDHLRERGYRLLDTQFTTEHLRRLGASEIPRDEYLRRLRDAIRLGCVFTNHS